MKKCPKVTFYSGSKHKMACLDNDIYAIKMSNTFHRFFSDNCNILFEQINFKVLLD